MATLDATLAGPTSNSYVDLAEAELIASNFPFGDDWIATPEDERVTALIVSTRYLETLDYIGERCESSQRLKWPRDDGQDENDKNNSVISGGRYNNRFQEKVACDGVEPKCDFIPYQIKETEVILAWQYIQDPKQFPGFGGSSGDTAPAGTYVSRQKIDVLEIEYAQFNENQYNDDCSDCTLPALLQTFPWVGDLLGCWLGTNSKSPNRLIRLFRN